MHRKILAAVVMSCCAALVQAQPPQHSGVTVGLDAETADVLPTVREARRVSPAGVGLMKAMGAPGVTVDTVGDPDSFGRAKTYLGLAQTQVVSLQADCTGFPPEAGVCIETSPAPATTTVDEPDLATIELPGKATNSILCFTFTPFAQWQWANSTGSPQTAMMFLRPRVRIESDVLDDPSLIDPATGNPFNGVLMDSTISTFLQSRTLNDGESDFQYQATTRSCTGGLVSVRALREGYGLSDSVIKDFFKNPITITFGVYGYVAMVTDASYFVGIRLYGD